jgi:16S rRNA (uracil1498-N3)-methyltransferase
MDSISEIWRFPRFFSQSLSLSDEDMRHAKTVLRLRAGDKAVLSENGEDFLCEFTGSEFRAIESVPNEAEPSVRVRLFQCLPKSDKFDFIVQKAVELGVSEVIPVLSTRCVSRPDAKSATAKVTRWNKIAYEAAKQSGRGKVPVVADVLRFDDAIRECRDTSLNILFYECCRECGGTRLNSLISPISPISEDFADINILIGSEGGFEAREVELARESGWIPTTLGKRILRVETASTAALSVIMNLTGNI